MVTDSVSHEKLSGVTLTATSSAGGTADPFIESDLSDTGTYLGLGEAPGEWTIQITKSGYINQELTVTLESDGCHVEGQTLHVEMVAI